MKKYRFYFHWRKCHDRMSVHYRGQCLDAKDVVCKAKCSSKHNKRQPRLVMQGWASKVKVVDDVAYIL
jgi:hypothetical protein